MASISLNNLSFIAAEPLFSGVTLTLSPGERLGVVAGNGKGKSTLLKLIAGQLEPSDGSITISRGVRLGYMEQDVPLAFGRRRCARLSLMPCRLIAATRTAGALTWRLTASGPIRFCSTARFRR